MTIEKIAFCTHRYALQCCTFCIFLSVVSYFDTIVAVVCEYSRFAELTNHIRGFDNCFLKLGYDDQRDQIDYCIAGGLPCYVFCVCLLTNKNPNANMLS